MRLARALERRLETLLDGVAGRLFRGPLHPTELAGRLVRAMDLDRPADADDATPAANRLTIRIHPSELAPGDTTAAWLTELSEAVEAEAWDRGWRLEGPAVVEVAPDEEVAPGTIRVIGQVEPGSRPPWATLRGEGSVHELTRNRAVIGRGSGCDVVLDDERVSRRHAVVWRESDRAFARDLGSANGTLVDGSPADHPLELHPGSVLTVGPSALRFEER
jgi:hypothetical protein